MIPSVSAGQHSFGRPQIKKPPVSFDFKDGRDCFRGATLIPDSGQDRLTCPARALDMG